MIVSQNGGPFSWSRKGNQKEVNYSWKLYLENKRGLMMFFLIKIIVIIELAIHR